MDELRLEVEEEMDGELEMEEMVEELLDFDCEVRGPEDEMEEEDESMWTLEDPGRGGRAGERRRRRRCIRAGEEEEEEEDGHEEGGGSEKERGVGQRRKKALKADKEDDTQSHSSRLSFSSQSQHSVEPMGVEADDLGDAAKQVEHLT